MVLQSEKQVTTVNQLHESDDSLGGKETNIPRRQQR